jgi:hypothetical protein
MIGVSGAAVVLVTRNSTDVDRNAGVGLRFATAPNVKIAIFSFTSFVCIILIYVKRYSSTGLIEWKYKKRLNQPVLHIMTPTISSITK